MKPTKKWKIAGINFDHDHMGDNLRMAFNHPQAEIVEGGTPLDELERKWGTDVSLAV